MHSSPVLSLMKSNSEGQIGPLTKKDIMLPHMKLAKSPTSLPPNPIQSSPSTVVSDSIRHVQSVGAVVY